MDRYKPQQWTNELMYEWTNALNTEHLSHLLIASTEGAA